MERQTWHKQALLQLAHYSWKGNVSSSALNIDFESGPKLAKS